MSIQEIPDTGYFLIANISSLDLGSYQIPVNCDVKLAYLRVLNVCTSSFSYTLKLVLAGSVSGSILASSEVVLDTTTTGQSSGAALWDLTFDFTPYALKATETYYARLELTGYTRAALPNEMSTYLGVWCDWYNPVGGSNTGGARIVWGALQ
jgi:hypothetical protein